MCVCVCVIGGGEWVVRGKRGIKVRERVARERLKEEKGINIIEKERREGRIDGQECISHYIPLHHTLSQT
jgi:hypothetical protein